MARASGSYPAVRRFKSHRRYHFGPLVKRSRHRPFTAETWVRFPYGSPTHANPNPSGSDFSFYAPPKKIDNLQKKVVDFFIQADKAWYVIRAKRGMACSFGATFAVSLMNKLID